MSEINDLIRTSSILAFNQGLDHGIRSERERILRLANEASVTSDIGDYVYIKDLIDYMEEDSASPSDRLHNRP